MMKAIGPGAKVGKRVHFRGAGAVANWCLAIVLAAILNAPQDSEAQARKIYVFGNSLIHHASDSEKTAVPYWLGYLGQKRARPFALDGQWGFLRNFARDLPPVPQWGFSNVITAWPRSHRSFEGVGYDTLIINPANFIQYQGADRPFDGENQTGETPLSTAKDLLQQVGQGKRVLLYEGWSDMAQFLRSFPPRARQLQKFHDFNQGAYHDWYVDFTNQLNGELDGTTVELVPIARILSRAFTETGMKDIPVTELYSDDAPHGTSSLYFLAAVPTYVALFGDWPETGDVPADVHPLIQPHFADFMDIVREELADVVAGSTSAPVPQIETGPLNDSPAVASAPEPVKKNS